MDNDKNRSKVRILKIIKLKNIIEKNSLVRELSLVLNEIKKIDNQIVSDEKSISLLLDVFFKNQSYEFSSIYPLNRLLVKEKSVEKTKELHRLWSKIHILMNKVKKNDNLIDDVSLEIKREILEKINKQE